jgi:antitoxin Xre/MbcA/ParS-like protein
MGNPAALEFLLQELGEFYSPEEARLWLFAPHRLLQGERPADLIQQGRIDEVFVLLDQLRDGAYASRQTYLKPDLHHTSVC